MDRPASRSLSWATVRSAPLSSLALLLCATTVASGTGCSLALVNGPPPAPPPNTVELDCTQQYVLPVVDGVVSANAAGVALIGLAGWALADSFESSDPYYEDDHRDEATAYRNVFLVAGALTVLTAISSVSGFHKVSACKAAQASIDGAPHIIFGRPPGPTAPVPPPPPPPSATPPAAPSQPLDPPLPDSPTLGMR
jgi:hypothetical protein